jgi:2-polyprenyl-6-methoxyphenol hydroxylase-like FAD-dependent oxidoreductase
MIDIPVLIVGGGPVGLAMAIELGWRGIECLLVEQGDGSTDFPRANTIDLRSMEFCRRWGIADAVRAAGLPADFPHTALYATSLAGYEIARFERGSHGGKGGSAISPERPQRCNQLFFDPVLRAHASAMAGVTLRHSCRFESFTQDDKGVTATVRDLTTDKEETIRATYLIACCGGRSPIRKSLGIELGDEGVLGYPVSVFFKTEALWARHDKGKTALNFLLDPGGVWATLIPLDGKELWRITLHGSKTYTDPATIDAPDIIRRVVGTDFEYELLSVGNWTRREMVAPRYRYGRVFLAGDSAHQNTPTGGYGMNTGLGDAVDLGWKIAAMVDGWGGAARRCWNPMKPTGGRWLNAMSPRRRPISNDGPMRRPTRCATPRRTAKTSAARSAPRSSTTIPDSTADRASPWDTYTKTRRSALPMVLRHRPIPSPITCRRAAPAPARRMPSWGTEDPFSIFSAPGLSSCGWAAPPSIRRRSASPRIDAVCRSPLRQWTTLKSPSCTNFRWFWCDRTGTSRGAATFYRTIPKR